MGKKNKLDNKMPGPGAYYPDIKPVTPRPPAFSIACKPPPPHDEETNPGPGAYTTEPTHLRFGPCFTIPGRHASTRELEERALLPGPGAYRGDSAIVHAREPSYSMLGRRIAYPKEVSPGPGAYGNILDGTGPSYTILGKREGPNLSSAMAEIPGPGAYNAALEPRSPSISFAGRYGSRGTEDGPGPGQYGAASTLSGPSFSIARRRAQHPTEESPGPGQYSTEGGTRFLARKEPAYSISGRLRGRARTADNAAPGPGSYNPVPIPGDGGRACVILGRQPARKIETSPGPGAYFWKPSKRPATPAYTIAGRYPRSSAPDSGPGPGAYSPPDTNWGGPAFTMSSRKSVKAVRESPGPGEYKVSGNKIVDASPAFSIGVRLPPGKAPDPVPGPGAYGAKSSLGGPAYTLTGRGED